MLIGGEESGKKKKRAYNMYVWKEGRALTTFTLAFEIISSYVGWHPEVMTSRTSTGSMGICHVVTSCFRSPTPCHCIRPTSATATWPMACDLFHLDKLFREAFWVKMLSFHDLRQELGHQRSGQHGGGGRGRGWHLWRGRDHRR